MQHRLTLSPSLFRNIPRSYRPSRVTLTVAAATAATAVLAGTAAAAAGVTASPHVGASSLPATQTTAVLGNSGPIMSASPVQQATGQAGPAHAGPAHAGPAGHGSGAHVTLTVHPRGGQQQHAPAQGLAKQLTPARPYTMYDSTTPSAVPAHQPIAVYSTGSYAASPNQLGSAGPVTWIDTTGSNYHASVLDVEPGDATAQQAASWAFHRLQANPSGVARIYTYLSGWAAVQSAIHGLPGWMQSHVHYWIADPTGAPHIVPGSYATQWNWGSQYDTSMVKPGF